MVVVLALAAAARSPIAAGTAVAAEAAAPASHAPLRPLPTASQRPRSEGPGFYADARRGADANPGTEAAPWRTINHALKNLSPGDTLYLRGGTYYENVYCAVAGRPDAPVTVRSFPGELAVIDGGIPEFQESPAEAWAPAPGGAAGEYRSARPYKNVRDVVGMFGDSFVGLQTYWHAADLRAGNELLILDKGVARPVYCGPGLWYDKQTGFVHARLAHTHVDAPSIANYAGETDPRELPLIVAPFNSVPLLVDQAMHVRFQDLVVRGGGHRSVVLQFGVDLAFENVTVYAGTYGIWSKGTGPLKMTDCAVYGMIPPWSFWDDNALHTYTPDGYDPFVAAAPGAGRNIARLPTHALLVTEGSFEFEVFYYPYNHDWEVARCEFAHGHDGVYLSGRRIRFHHNLVDDNQDDAIYLSSPTPYISDDVRVYQNLVRQCMTPFGAHARGGPGGELFIYRNVVDLRKPLRFSRPTPEQPKGLDYRGSLSVQTHDAGHILHMEKMNFYQNTFLGRANADPPPWGQGTLHGADPKASRRVLNNIFVYQGASTSYPALGWDAGAEEADLQVDGNLHWNPHPQAKVPPDLFRAVRELPVSKRNAARYGAAWEANGVAGDPQFTQFDTDPRSPNDYRLRPGSPARGAGVTLPEGWPDPLRPPGGSPPDIGALPIGAEPLRVGIGGRHVASE